jgi:hypothetical protein
MTTRRTAIMCGIIDEADGVRRVCVEDLVRTESPASVLHCAVHGDVLGARPSPPLDGVVHLNYGGRGEWLDLAELAR